MKKPYIIGIAGGSAGGKTTFASALAENLAYLRVRLFHMDGYFKPETERPYSKAPVTGRFFIDDNHPLTMDIPRFRRDISAAAQEDSCEVIIAEGLLTLYDDELAAMLDLKLFVDCRPDERIVRRLRRNMAAGQGFDEIADVYLDLVRYRHDEYVEPSKWRADLILNGSAPSAEALRIISESIQARVAENN